jgi:hypothetical protein
MKKSRGLVNFSGLMVNIMLAIGRKVIGMETVYGPTAMEIAIMGLGSREKARDTEHTSSVVFLAIFRSVISRIIC